MSGALLRRLEDLLGAGSVRTTGDGLPCALPESTEAVAMVCRLAHREGWRIRVEGRGSWCQADAPCDLVLATRELSRVISLSPADLVASVEAGLPLDALQDALEQGGAWLALDPPGSARRSVGSVVATATSGPLRHGFGAVRDHLLGVTVVTGDGRVVRAGGQVVKNVAGYDLTRLQVGGFGAFGIITELHLRLRALPAVQVTLLAHGGRDALTRQARDLVEQGLAAQALELLSPGLTGSPEWTLALRLGGTEGGVRDELDRARARAEAPWTELPAEAARSFWARASGSITEAPITVRMGVFADGLDELIDSVEQRLGPGLVSAGPGCGMLRWSGSAPVAALREVRRIAAEREIPLTLERAPWPVRAAVGHFGAYREGVGRLVGRLRETFDPAATIAVAIEGTEGE